MKKILFLVLTFIIIYGCNNSSNSDNLSQKEDSKEFNIVKSFINSMNNNDTAKINDLLATNFIIKMNGEETTKNDMYEQFNQSYTMGMKEEIVSENQTDSIIDVIVNSSNNFMNLLKTPPIQVKMKFVVNNKISKLSTDTMIGTYKVYNELENKTKRFYDWLSIKYPKEIQSLKSIFEIPEKYIKEYSKLSDADLERFFQSNLRGEYICKDGLYNKLVFKGKSTVVVYGLGIPFPTSYVIDGNYIRIKTDKSDLLFKIKDTRTLIGEGFAKGIYIKK